MISLFDADDAFADDSAAGYQRYTTDFKLACLKRYFTPPMKPVRDLAAELGVPFSTLAEWVTKARKAVIRTALRNGLIPERYLAWLFENSRKLPTERPMPWSDDVPDSCRALAE